MDQYSRRSGMEGGLNQGYAALDDVLARMTL
jgi:hypothetical protein